MGNSGILGDGTVLSGGSLASINLLVSKQFHAFDGADDLSDSQAVIPFHDDHLAAGNDLLSHQKFNRLLNLLVEFENGTRADLENVTQQHIPLTKVQGDVQFNVPQKVKVRFTVASARQRPRLSLCTCSFDRFERGAEFRAKLSSEII